MPRLGIALAVLLLALADRMSASAQRLRGRLLDVESTEPLAAGLVSLLTTAGTSLLTAVTDVEGHWVLEVPAPGSYYVTAKRIGYQPKTVSEVQVPAAGGVQQDIALTAEVFQMDAITVTATAERGSATTALEEVRNAPTIMNSLPAELIEVLRSPRAEGRRSLMPSYGYLSEADLEALAAYLLALPYLGLVIGGRKGDWLKPENIIGLFRSAGPRKRFKVLDTSVIIDGRIADICETGFMDGTLVIPQFVLKELQLVADSSDSMKRNRGRRGLDILQKIQKMAGVDVTISDMDFPDVREVDLKLIELARSLQGKIVTNDFNLNKVAQLRGVEVLNINELANSLKPVVLPGEIMKVFILKEGKEYNQGVAYLDDGTMVVVDNARKMIGRTIDVVVTSVLQTTAGKMIFGRFIDAAMAAQAAPAPARPQIPPSAAAAGK